MSEPSENLTETPIGGAIPLAREEVICGFGVREATPVDLCAMLDMAEKFIGAAWSHIGVPYSPATCATLLASMIDNSQSLVLVTEDMRGMMGAVVYPWHFNADVLTGQELFWWSESRAGMELIATAERWAAAMGAVTFNMACMDHMRGKAMSRLYQRRGYSPNEHIFIKGLN